MEITPLVDGEFRTPPTFFGDDVDFSAHADLLDAEGQLHLPIGCFLLRGGPLRDRTVLIDAGLGEIETDQFTGGALLDELAAAGVRPADIDAVVCSHLHLDHCGWVAGEDAQPTFPNAEVWVGGGDWAHFIEEKAGFVRTQIAAGLKGLADAGKVHAVDGDASVAPGVTTLAAPGHTPGHLVVVLSSGGDRALLLGDAITCPLQLDETDWAAVSDVDPALARRTRARLWDEIESTGAYAAGAHFPELQFGRVLAGQGRRYWQV
jgi:glyoxylase-like metal-dependent hydrolase (beta-lactamase superfamily II)